MNLDCDFHIHTFHSPCGRDEMIPAQIVRTAADAGISRLGITDHFYPFTDPGIFSQIRSDLSDKSDWPDGNSLPQVFFGCEVEVMSPGKVAGGPDLAEKLDYIMAGATHFQNTGITELPKVKDDRAIARHYLAMFAYAVSLPWVDVIAHPFFVVPSVCSVEVLEHIREEDLLPPLETARQNGIAMEISRRVFWPGQIHFSLPFYRLCKEAGLKFSIGSDAHALADIGNVRCLEPVIAELGLSEKDFWDPQSKKP